MSVQTILPDQMSIQTMFPDHMSVQMTLPDQMSVQTTLPNQMSIQMMLPDQMSIQMTLPDQFTHRERTPHNRMQGGTDSQSRHRRDKYLSSVQNWTIIQPMAYHHETETSLMASFIRPLFILTVNQAWISCTAVLPSGSAMF